MGIQPSEIWRMTWPDYLVLMIHNQEQMQMMNPEKYGRAVTKEEESWESMAKALYG